MSHSKNKSRRRGNGEGSIYFNGRYWVAQATVGYNPSTGKIIRKSIYGKTKRIVSNKLFSFLSEISKSDKNENFDMQVAEWAHYWLSNFKKYTVSKSTYYRYESIVNTHIIKNLGNCKLSELTLLDIQNTVNKLSRLGLSDSYISSIYTKINCMMKKAIDVGIISKNPCTAVVLPVGVRKNSLTALSIKEQKMLTEYCYGKLNGLIFIFQLGTGMRIGETLALTWNAVDFAKEEIHVRASICEVKGSQTIQDKTKTPSGTRIIPMSAEIKSLLIGIRSSQNSEKNVPDLVFPSTSYKIQYSSNVRSRLYRYCEAAGIRKISVHTLRHTFATRAIEQNINIKVLSALMGHKDISVTLNTYAHILSDFKREDFFRIDIFKGGN